MAKPYRTRSMRNLGSAGYSAAKLTVGTVDKAAVGLFKWATTDNSGINASFSSDSVRQSFPALC